MPKWKDQTFVAFDTETSGAYPLGADVVEFGAVKWQNGEVIGEYQTLLKPREKMSDFIIGIHGITNEMVADAPTMDQKVSEILEFLGSSVLMAHHAPFDLGFMAIEFEINSRFLPVPYCAQVCFRESL
jgi:DNA polymerase-3 subunit epsilon